VHGCNFGSVNASITQPTQVTFTNSSSSPVCSGEANGAITITPAGGSPSYTVTIGGSPGASRSSIGSGAYAIVVKDSNNCTATGSISLSDPPQPTVSLSVGLQPTCVGFTDGSVVASVSGGQGSPFTYQLFKGTTAVGSVTGISAATTISTLGAGSYSIVGYDKNSCARNSSTVVLAEQAASLAASITTYPAKCYGGSTGIISVSPSGSVPNYNLQVAPLGASAAGIAAGATHNFTSIPAGNYTVTVTDSFSCSKATSGVIVGQPSAFTINATYTAPLCVDQKVPVNVTVTGGTAPFTYSVSGSATATHNSTSSTTDTFANLGVGTYSFTASDANGCLATTSPIVFSVASPVSIAASDRTCFLDTTGRVFVKPSGGTPSGTGTYSITNTGTPTGTYNVDGSGEIISTASGVNVTITVTDSNGCSASAVLAPNKPTATLGATAVTSPSTCHSGDGLNDGSIALQVTGGTGPFTATLSPDPTMVGTVSSDASGNLVFHNVSGNSEGNATFINILDRNLCPFNTSVVVASPPPLTVLVDEKTIVTCHNDVTASLESQLTGGNGRPYSSMLQSDV
jgi:large repetitive protein